MARRGIFEHPIVRRSGTVSSGEARSLAVAIFKPRTSGVYYTTQFANDMTGATLTTAPVGRMGVMFAGGTHSWDAVTIPPATTGTRTARIGVYSLDDDTLLPNALLVDAGVVGLVDLVPDILSISITTTANWLGLAAVLESDGSGTFATHHTTHSAGAGGPQLFGSETPPTFNPGGLIFVSNILTAAVSVGSGLPSPATWIHGAPSATTNDGGVYIRKA